MKWKKEILLIILGLVMIRMSSGITANITAFDDGGSAFNITSNYTGYITIPINATITEANVSLKGISKNNTIDEQTDWMNTSDILTFPNSDVKWQWADRIADNNQGTWGYYYAPNSVNCLASYSNTGHFVTNYSMINTTNNIKNNTLFLNWHFWHVITNTGSCTSTINTSLFVWNYTLGDWQRVYNQSSRNTVNDEYNITVYLNNSNDFINSTSNVLLTKHSYSLQMGGSGTSISLYVADVEENLRYETYPQNVNISTNLSYVFSQSGNLTSNSSISLNKTLIQNYVTQQQTIPINFSASQFGMLEISNLIITYNITNSAILSILSPAQITQSIISGSGFTQAINVSNSGNWNATNISFETISQSATPNLNDSITHDCSNITIIGSSSVICNVTFSSLTISAEPDEKIRVKTIGTDNNDIIYSTSIDLDVTVTTPTQSGGGGGGGQPSKCEWRVYRPANRVINALGYLGYKTAPISFQIYNNESQPISFTYFVQGVPCQIEKNTELIQGSSFGLNTIQCDYPIKEDTGQIIVLGGSCSQSIDVKLSSSEIGLGLTYLSGGAGIIPALLLYGIGALALIFTFKIMQ